MSQDQDRIEGALSRLRGSSRFTVIAALAVAVLALAACGDGDEVAEEESPTADETAEATPSPTDGDEAAAETVTITAVDYAFEGVPETVEPGTELTLQNDSSAEAHEIIALKIPEDEDRPVSELVQLPPEEQPEGIQMVGVALAPPEGSGAELPTPPLVLEEPGRYALICGLPKDAPPEEVLEAAREFVQSGATEGEPDYPETGPPHFTEGMFAEISVEG